jgi:MerR family transcriptional regulator, mercuric resistance operon regulatory protein
METNRLVTIGALSERTEVNIETIRYYERIGILPRPPRSAGGHRLYAEEYQQRFLFVRRARELGFSLGEVGVLLGLARQRSACAQVKSITEQHIADIHRKINELKRLERALSDMVTQCRGDDALDCPILDALAT